MTAWRSFVHGATRPSLAALFGAAAVVMVCLWGAVTGLRPERFAALDASSLTLDGEDDYGRLSHEVLALSARRWERPTVLLLGPSSLRECLTTPAGFTREVEAAADLDLDVFDLAADDSTFAEYAGVLDVLPDGFRGVVALTVSPTMFARLNARRLERQAAREEMQLGWVSAARDAELRALGVHVPARTGYWAIDVAPFLLARLDLPLRRLIAGPAEFRWHRMNQRVPLANLELNRRSVRARLSRYEEAAPGAFATLERLMDAFARRSEDVRFLLFEQTELPGGFASTMGEERYEAYHDEVTGFAAAREDTDYLDLNHVLVRADFADLVHLGRLEGRAKYTRALAREVAARLPATEV